MKTYSFSFTRSIRHAVSGLILAAGSFAAQGAADLWIRDDISDVGNEPNNQSALLYLSDDIWIRRLPDPNYDPQPFPSGSPTWIPQPHEGPCYRDPKSSSPNYIYVRVRNRGSTASSGTETLHVYWAKASTGLNWSSDWNDHLANPCGGPLRLYGYEVTKPRSNAANVAVSVRNDYVTAVQTIDTASFQFPDGSTYFDKQDNVHFNLFNSGIHGTLRFLPWHREFINRYEALLREVKPALTLLYWDWTTDPAPTIIGPGGYMGASSGVVGAPFATFGLSRGKPAGAPVAPGLAPSYQALMTLPSLNFAALWGKVEVPSHNSAHCYINGTMCTGNAARDPIFFMLHANCDRVWSLWQRQNSSNVDPWAPSRAYDASQGAAAITSDLRPWDGTDGFSPWQNQIPGDPNGYVIHKAPTHHSIVYPPIYEDALLKVPVLGPGQSCIIEIPFYPPPFAECGGFVDPQHLCLLARIEPVGVPAETAALWQNVKDHNNIAWRNVTLSDCNVGPFFRIAPGRIGAAGELIRNLRNQPAAVTIRFSETQSGFRSLFQYGRVRLRLEDNLYAAWLRGGRQGQGVEATGTNEVYAYGPGATLAGLVLNPGEAGRMDVALELFPNYQEPFGDVYHLDMLQYDDQGGQEPVGGQRYDLDFNQLPIVRKGSDWKFLDGGQIPPANWTGPNYDDQNWKMGGAPFGYGRTDVASGLRGTATGQPATSYFRQSFYVPDPTFYHNLALNLIQDDGLVVYLNGQEIARLNMPAGAVDSATRALTPMTGAAARACRSINVGNFLTLLRPGQNILAAELHPAVAANKVDMTFDTELAGNIPSTPYQPPTVVISTPVNGDLFRLGNPVPILADVFDPDGDLAEVRIYADGNLIAQARVAPFSASFNPTSPGRHRVSVEAADTFGHLTRMESLVTVVSNLVPVVDMITPLGQTFFAGSSVTLVAGASDPDGGISNVTFYVQQHVRFDAPRLFIGKSLSSPYMAQATNLPPGHYLALAVATDNQGAEGYSSSGHFTIKPPAGSPDITIRYEAPNGARVITLEWERPGAVLERAPKVTGPWQGMPGAASPYPIDPAAGLEFYRLRL